MIFLSYIVAFFSGAIVGGIICVALVAAGVKDEEDDDGDD